jgi:hypothetical protein
MLSSIHPLGERSRHNRFVVTAAAHIVGAVLGGALLGVVLGGLAEAVARLVGEPVRVAALAAIVVAAAVLELAGRRPPSWRRQVNEVWLTTYRGWVYGSGFGVQLGAAVVTIVTSPLTYVMVAAALLSGSFGAAVAVATAFGLARGLTLLVAARIQSPTDLAALHRGLAAAARPMTRLASAAMAACALVLAGALVA